MFKIRTNLLLKVLIAIFLGILLSHFLITPFVRCFVTINALFTNFLNFMIPLLILGLVTPGIAELGKNAGKLLIITVLIAYGSTLFAGFFSYFTTSYALPFFIDKSHALPDLNTLQADSIAPYFSIDLPPIMAVTSALALAFVIGMGLSLIDSHVSKNLLLEFRALITAIIQKAIIPILPLYIFGVFLKITKEGQVFLILGIFFKVILLIFVMHLVLLLLQYLAAGLIARQNPFKALKNMLPAYMTALGTQSSAATIPVTLAQTKKNNVDPEIADFVVPLCATIHLAGSILKIVACAYVIMWIMKMPTGLDLYSGFIFMLGIIMVAAPGVPGGAIMASLGILQSMLGFNQTLIGLMIALYITMDSFGTACNVTGDGAIALVINKIYAAKHRRAPTLD